MKFLANIGMIVCFIVSLLFIIVGGQLLYYGLVNDSIVHCIGGLIFMFCFATTFCFLLISDYPPNNKKQ